jgi:hypothetical protein
MNRYPPISAGTVSVRQPEVSKLRRNQRIRLSVTRWQQMQFVPTIIRQKPQSKLSFFNP